MQTPAPQRHSRWNARLVTQVIVMVLVNVMADTVIVAPLLVLPQMLEHFDTDQAAWLGSSAMLAGAMWAPLLGRCADLYGKRRVLSATLGIACLGAAICLVAPNIWAFVIGRALQGAAVAAVLLTVVLIRDLCTPRVAMPAVGIVTSGSAAIGVGSAFLFERLAAEFGFRSVFVVSAICAVIGLLCVQALIPKTPASAIGRIDVVGAVLLGGGVAAVLGYVSLGSEQGWLSIGPLLLLVGGLAILTTWLLSARRTPDPVIDIDTLSRPLIITLMIVVLGAGAYQSLSQLMSLVASVTPDQDLGYGIAGPGALGMLFGVPALGVMAGGTAAGVLANRIGPDRTLAAGVAIGLLGATGMFYGVTQLAAAVLCSCLLSLSAGALITSGFNMVAMFAPVERQGAISSLVMVVVAIGSVTFNFLGAAVLNTTKLYVGGEAVNSATGVLGYVAMAVSAYTLAMGVAALLVRSHRRTRGPLSVGT